MSHTSTYKHKVKDVNLFITLARALGYEAKIGKNISVRHFASGTVPNAVAAIKLPGWKYEIAIKEDGEILYDHWGSGAGSFDKLGNLIQTYNRQIIADAIPHSEIEMFTNVLQKDGDIKMVLEYA
jgi:hypothetical protein